MILMNTKNSKTSKPQKCVLNLSHRLDLINFCSSKLQKFLLFKYIRQQYKNNKLNIIVPMWNYEFVLPDGSFLGSDIQDYIG